MLGTKTKKIKLCKMLEQIIKFTVETLYLLLRCSDRHQNVVHTHTKKYI